VPGVVQPATAKKARTALFGNRPRAPEKELPKKMQTKNKDYQTVYWGKMPVNFRLVAFRKHEVQKAIGYARRGCPDVLDLVPDFSVLTIGKDPEGNNAAVLTLGEEGDTSVLRRGAEESNLEGMLWEVALRIRRQRREARREHALAE
jgi:hypothetical protein